MPDISLARYPDGSGPWEIFNHPTPGLYNYYLGLKNASKTPDDIAIFPNPTNGRFSLVRNPMDDIVQGQSVDIVVYNHTGQLIMREVFHSGFPVEIDLSGYPSGIYLLRVNEAGRLSSKQIILIN